MVGFAMVSHSPMALSINPPWYVALSAHSRPELRTASAKRSRDAMEYSLWAAERHDSDATIYGRFQYIGVHGILLLGNDLFRLSRLRQKCEGKLNCI
jgi:hypothetical protein